MELDRFLSGAGKEARKSDRKQKHGAIVLRRNKPIAYGHNKTKTHPRVDKYGHYCIHAECDALMKEASGDTLLVVRIMKNGTFSCSKPCARCLEFIKDYGIKKVFYTDWCGSIQELVF